MEVKYWIGIVFWSFVWGLTVIGIGRKRGESRVEAIGGFVIGFLLGPIGVLLALASKGNRINCPFCKQLIDPTALICPHCRSEISNGKVITTKPVTIYTDELLKLKQLLDEKAITQDEFNVAKTRILGV